MSEWKHVKIDLLTRKISIIFDKREETMRSHIDILRRAKSIDETFSTCGQIV